MASFLVRALSLPATDSRPFVDSVETIHAGDIASLAEAGITMGCNPEEGGDRYCPDEVITRGELAAFIHRAFR
jgi:hypothetical protein